MASQTRQLHFLLVPLMSQSHLIPFTEMAKVISSHGVRVTIVLTPLNAARFNKVIDQANASNLKIHFLSLPFPCLEAGLPEGCENIDTLPSPESLPLFFAASNMLKEPVEKWLMELETLPNCIVSDLCLPWTSNVASKFNIPRVVFHGISCFTLLCSHNINNSKVLERVTSMSEPFLVPDLPDRIELTKAQLPEATIQASKAWDQFKTAELSAQGVLINTFEELETMYVKGYEKVVRKIWSIGPLSLSDKLISQRFGMGGNDSIHESECLNFLNSNKPRSVIYVCFGSLGRLQASQLMELALGLEASNHPFIWVIKQNDYSSELKKWLVEESFQERMKGRGLIIKGWAPQVQILSHAATGGFLTHCGWNSTLEGVCSGVPMITWPMFAEQFFNEKLIVQVLKTGVSIGVEVSTEKAGGVLVRREYVKKAIDQLMDKGDEGEHRRNRARALGEMAHKAVEEGGSSHLNCKSFIQHIMDQADI
nr:UDP-glycosyltransferase 73C3-1 [Gleditsia microphylla]